MEELEQDQNASVCQRQVLNVLTERAPKPSVICDGIEKLAKLNAKGNI